MLNFAQLKFLLTGLTLLTVLAACSDDNTSTEAPPATIEIAELSPEADNVSFRLIPTNAISMAYKIEIEGGGDDADFVSIIIGKTKCDGIQNQMRLFGGRVSPKRKATKISHTHTKKHRSNGF